jgi:very-short-patch-repair endonuclease
LELKLLSLLRKRRLPLPETQYEIRTSSGARFRADFAWPHARLIIEVQGYKWHGGRRAWQRDLSRNSELAMLGWRVIYVTWDDLVSRPHETLLRIERAIQPELWGAVDV